jgi:hypothetical protein
MDSLGGKEQVKALKSFRRHLDKVENKKHTNFLEVVRTWNKEGFSQKWREYFNKHHG